MDQSTAQFADFYAKSRAGCLRAVYAAVGDRHLAEELVAESFARAWAGWRTVSRHPAPQAWVVRTALNTHVSWWRRKRREVAWDGVGGGRSGPAEPAARPDPGSSAVDEEVLALLRQLPLRQREVIVLRIFLDLDTQATADALGIAPGTVKAHLNRATTTLRGRLIPPVEQETSA